MAIWPFNRKKNESTDLPQEVQDYYQSEKRQRAGVAGLLAVGTLIVTVLLALGLFFGGRWAYRTVFDKDNNKDNNTSQTETTGSDNTPAEQPASDTNQGTTPSPEATTLQPAGSDTNAPAPSSSNTPAQAPNNIPNTGPGDVVALFIGTVIVAAATHYVITNKRQLV